MPDPFVVMAATPRGWAATLHAHATDHGGVAVRATVLTAADARTEHCDVVVVDDITSFLSPALVADLHQRGRAVLGVFDPDDPDGRTGLLDAGVDGLVPADADPAELALSIRGLAEGRRRAPVATPPRRVSRPAAPSRTRVVGVTGPGGGVGVTEVAVELAALIGMDGQPTVLLDADEVAPSVAQRLGLALQPGVLAGVDAARRRTDVTVGLHPLTARQPLTAMPGMTMPQDWATVPEGGLTDLVQALGAERSCIVVDLGHCPEPVDGGPRFGHAAALAARCTDLVLVTAPSPIAIARTLSLAGRIPRAHDSLHVVLNRVDDDRFVRDEAVAELQASLGMREVHCLAEDRRVGRAAWQGDRVRRGRFRRDLAAAARSWGLV